MARSLRRDHHHVEIAARLDQVEMDVEPVGEHQRRAFLHIAVQLAVIDSACNSSGVSIIITSAHLAASATSITLSFSPSPS